MGKKKSISEVSLFKKLHVFVLDVNKKQLNELKDIGTLMSNTDLDNSVLIRGFIDYFYNNKDKFQELVPYFQENKGYSILAKLQKMIQENNNYEEISKETGISVEHLNDIIPDEMK